MLCLHLLYCSIVLCLHLLCCYNISVSNSKDSQPQLKFNDFYKGSFGTSKEPLSVEHLAGIDTSTQESATEVNEERPTPRIITVKSVEDKKSPSPSISDVEEINSSPLGAQNVEENHKEKINVVLKLPPMEDDVEYSMDDISQYELSNTSGGEL